MKIEKFASGETDVENSGRRMFALDENSLGLSGSANDNRLRYSGQIEKKPANALGGWTKRLADVVIASVTLVAALPIMILVAAILKLGGSDVFFKHARIGLNGRKFQCYKFTTMGRDPDEKLARFLAGNPDAAAEWQSTQKLKVDPRVTFFGRILRKSSIDELPQLFNVLRGEMSCIGPRPVTAKELPKYGSDVRKYLSCRPGITGYWQVSGRSTLNFEQRVALDTHYVDNWSLRGDFLILLRTISAVLRFNETS